MKKVLLGATLDQKPSLERIDIHQVIADCATSFQLKVRERDGTLTGFFAGDLGTVDAKANTLRAGFDRFLLLRATPETAA